MIRVGILSDFLGRNIPELSSLKKSKEDSELEKKKLAVSLSFDTLLVAIGIGFAAFSGPSTISSNKAGDPTITVALRGHDEGFMMDIPTTSGGATQGLCFNVDVVDVSTGKVIGDATDCLADIDGGVILTGITFFNFPGGQLVSRGRTTVQPLNEMAPGSPITHITGAIPAPGTDQILSGTGRFKNAGGTVRLPGAVDLSGFAGNVGDPVSFDLHL